MLKPVAISATSSKVQQVHNDGGWCYTAGSTLTELPVLCGDADGRGGGGAIRCEVHPSASGEPTAVTDMTCGSSSDSRYALAAVRSSEAARGGRTAHARSGSLTATAPSSCSAPPEPAARPATP
eukprot:CAMPEP_0206143944 /NCGR_PEP_ID=MMETSP1473-20131121/22465_1 /ASSEMBLY_ACC=CAM_ASM_001109 /TAXON_ID=1461547 /ORGANISM="Stichococcus sp, Strain RCC1054" /LENGTH=123 /DNA_ID=CAMNT_0053539587 /DNA_START=236 /DNA_END=605 /DNA_ORIENTATION=-